MAIPYERQVEELRKAQARSHKRHLRKTGGNLRGQVRRALRSRETSPHRYRAIFGCTYAELAAHIERQFQPGMTWDNMGEWHVDHIIPLAVFLEQGRGDECSHYTNLQPLWAAENLSKGRKT